MFTLFDKAESKIITISGNSTISIHEADDDNFYVLASGSGAVLFQGWRDDCEHFLHQLYLSMRSPLRAEELQTIRARAIDYATDARLAANKRAAQDDAMRLHLDANRENGVFDPFAEVDESEGKE